MAPAFSSRRQALALALLLAVLLSLPALMAKSGLLDRRDVYASIIWRYGPFAWIQQNIFGKSTDVDIAFLGSSHIWVGVDTPYVQRQLSRQLGRSADVFTLGWGYRGFDALYIIAHDLIVNRHVHMLVVYDEGGPEDAPHIASWRWFRFGENPEVLAGLPRLDEARLYSGAVLGMARQLLSLVRPNLLLDPLTAPANYWNDFFHTPNIAENLGAVRVQSGFGHTSDFAPFQPAVIANPEDVQVYSGRTRDSFRFTGPPTPPYSLHFARLLARLCQERGTQLVVLHLPQLPELKDDVIPQRENWAEEWGAPAEIEGIAPAKLFAGIPESDVRKLFFDPYHLNLNGQQVFTPLITPALLKLYATFKGNNR